ncbi:FAD-dependent monooxygenase [Methanosarcina sp.]|uniref:FAD-dependent monooxygenase n=1 Tax=Methanosarcina sp. TaxID=2213 RepID=UPI002AB8F4BB|nr:FAD-dependent monooxygenase [Methanosarcina sp.]MDY9928011.1 FAD-dependent monooxygenase [Methanosarcina sp.]
MTDKKVLISGGGIAGLTLGILLKEKGWEPLVIERDTAVRTEGYMMGFFGTGWDVADRMGLLSDIKKVHYPIDYLEYVDRNGDPHFPAVPIEHVRKAFRGKYAFLRRPDLESILFNRALASGVKIRFGTTIQSIKEEENGLQVVFNDGTMGAFQLLFGADGVHSHVRELIFGPESQFARYIGYYVAAFHTPNHGYRIGRSLEIYEELGRVAWFYPLDANCIDAVYIFRHDNIGYLPHEKRLAFVQEQFDGAGWIAEDALKKVSSSKPMYFDAMEQIIMPDWHKGRIALLGDACGCLTLTAVQGSHMAMAGAYVIAQELERYSGDYQSAFINYQQFLKPFVDRKQNGAIRFAGQFVPSSRTKMVVRYPLIRLMFNKFFLSHFLNLLGTKSILVNYSQKSKD